MWGKVAEELYIQIVWRVNRASKITTSAHCNKHIIICLKKSYNYSWRHGHHKKCISLAWHINYLFLQMFLCIVVWTVYKIIQESHMENKLSGWFLPKYFHSWIPGGTAALQQNQWDRWGFSKGFFILLDGLCQYHRIFISLATQFKNIKMRGLV